MGIRYSEPLCEAAYKGDELLVSWLLDRDSSRLHGRDSNGDSALLAACRGGHPSIARLLLKRGGDVGATTKSGRSCLHVAVRRRFSWLDALLIVLLMPVLIGYWIMVQKRRFNEDLVKLLLEAGSDVNAVDKSGNTALHYACSLHNHGVGKLLLMANASVSIQNKEGLTAVDLAAAGHFKKLLPLLRQHQERQRTEKLAASAGLRARRSDSTASSSTTSSTSSLHRDGDDGDDGGDEEGVERRRGE
ncbi:ankyrin repeat domain-containing protein 22-like [Petromyzon marinus]|uniref:ankyrin repeat domain-containing protein 22-like n=1 Tax=Petromyzon marinus TaxID=7757 RepID=UPI003F726348